MSVYSNYGLRVGRKYAGFVMLWAHFTTLHIGVWRAYWQWGYRREWYDGPLHSFGCGPLFLVTWF